MDFWFHFGTFGVPWATQWHQFSLPGPGRVGLLGSLGGLLAFILQPCGVLYSWLYVPGFIFLVLYSWLYIPGFVFALYFCICIPGLIFLVVDSWFYSSGFIFLDLSFGLYSWRIWCKTAESALLLLLSSLLWLLVHCYYYDCDYSCSLFVWLVWLLVLWLLVCIIIIRFLFYC